MNKRKNKYNGESLWPDNLIDDEQMWHLQRLHRRHLKERDPMTAYNLEQLFQLILE